MIIRMENKVNINTQHHNNNNNSVFKHREYR